MGMNDDAIASCSTGSTTQADYIACVTLANAYKFQPNVCYFYTSYLTAQCGRGDLQFQEGAVGASVPSPSSPSPPSLYPRPAPLTRYTKPSPPPLQDISGCETILSDLPDLVAGSTALLVMICALCILQSYHVGSLYYLSIKEISTSIRPSTVDNPVAAAGGLGGSV